MSDHLFSPLSLRDITLKNRIAVSPMCQYSAGDGMATDWHMVHLGKFAQGGAALVMTEAAAVSRRGRITHGDLGIWSDVHAGALARITGFIRAMGAVSAVQLAHAGRKASMQRPWFGNGPLDADDRARGDMAWDILGPSPVPVAEGWMVPREMTPADIQETVSDFAAAAKRADRAGFDVAEVHAAHGYLFASFLSPASNRRGDAYGGDRAGRARALFETVETVRATWPDGKPLFVRISSIDGPEEAWSLEDSVWLAGELKALGVDVVDCSSGGIAGSATAGRAAPPQPGFQVPYASRIRRETGLLTQAVGLILEPAQADAVIRDGDADIVALGREMLSDPNWALHAARALDADPDFAAWPPQYGWWLDKRYQLIGR